MGIEPRTDFGRINLSCKPQRRARLWMDHRYWSFSQNMEQDLYFLFISFSFSFFFSFILFLGLFLFYFLGKQTDYFFPFFLFYFLFFLFFFFFPIFGFIFVLFSGKTDGPVEIMKGRLNCGLIFILLYHALGRLLLGYKHGQFLLHLLN